MSEHDFPVSISPEALPPSREGSFTGPHALSLYYQAWCPATAPKAVLVLVHGLGEYCGRYAPVATVLTQAGYALFGFDYQGHGRSAGQRGHIDRWQDYRDSVRLFLQTVRQQEPTAPLFILGYSLGGLIVLDYILTHPEGIAGVMVSAPPIHPVGVAKPHLVAFARLFSGLLPRLSLAVGMDAAVLSRDPAVVAAADSDALIHSMATLRWGTETLDAIARVRDQIHTLPLPILIVHGDADQVNAISGSQELFDHITFPDKTFKIYPGSYHEPHNDLDRQQVLTDLVDWLDAHLP
jgi:alpha-beta hydrolase superfamily lysophospholipase